MTHPAHDLLDDLVEAVPDHVEPARLAATAWRAGRRRLVRRRVAATGIVAIAAAALAIGVVPVLDDIRSLPPAGGEPSGVTSYPERLGHQWWVRDLPDRPGPVAGLVELVKESPAESKPLGWHVVSPGGHRWRLPADWNTGTEPTISPDGRHVGYLATADGPYVLHDLVTGERHEFAISAGFTNDDVPTSDAPYALHQQSPSFWSPDRDRVAVTAWSVTHDDVGQLILGVDGTMTEIFSEPEPPPGLLAGWASVEELVFVTPVRAEPDDWRSPIEAVEASVYAMDGRLVRAVELTADVPWERSPDQWGGAASPDGTEIVVRDVLEDSPGYYLRRFSLADGAHIESVLVPWPASRCGTGWTSSAKPTVAYWDSGYRHLTTAVVEGDWHRPLVAVEPRIGGRCLTWADDAIGGHSRGGVFGTSTAAWTWWWREIVVVMALVSVTGAALVRRRAG